MKIIKRLVGIVGLAVWATTFGLVCVLTCPIVFILFGSDFVVETWGPYFYEAQDKFLVDWLFD
jgi:hypothetical protein